MSRRKAMLPRDRLKPATRRGQLKRDLVTFLVMSLRTGVSLARLWKALVHQFLEIAQSPECAVIVKRQQLHHLDGANVRYRINPEFRVVDAGPAQAARAAIFCVLRIAGGNLKPEAELVVTRA